MKNLLFILFVLITFSCTKEDTSCMDSACAIQGEWEWTSTYGSIAGATWTPESTSMTKLLSIDENEISFFENDILVDTKEYSVFESDTILGGDISYTFLSYGTDTRLLDLNDDEMNISDLCADCYQDYYERK